MDAELRRTAMMLAFAALASACDPGEPDDSELRDASHCDGIATPTADSLRAELELQVAIDEARAHGGSCGALVRAFASDAVEHDASLQCAARRHALDMATRDFFAHEDPDGVGPWQRIAGAGYDTILATELVAMGQIDAQTLVEDLWLPSDPHCAAMLASEWIDIGVGQYAEPEPPPDDDTPAPTWWVVVLAMPAP